MNSKKLRQDQYHKTLTVCVKFEPSMTLLEKLSYFWKKIDFHRCVTREDIILDDVQYLSPLYHFRFRS